MELNGTSAIVTGGESGLGAVATAYVAVANVTAAVPTTTTSEGRVSPRLKATPGL